MSKPTRISFGLIALLLLVVGGFQLGTPLLAALFSYFALSKLHFGNRKWLTLVLFLVLIVTVTYALVRFLNRSVDALPKVASTAIPSVIAYAEHHGVELPFTDYQSLKEEALMMIKEQSRYWRNFANFARGVTREILFLVVGCVVALSLFLNARFEIDRGGQPIRNNLYSLCCEEVAARFRIFYESFSTVMGAQILISTINTALTSIFLLAVSLPYAGVVIGVTFLCGLLPVIGNLISNTVIVGIGFTISPRMALAALIFLVLIHKLEYFLNSKIIGDRIKNPVWLTLLALIIGERLMGIPGMILAPVILHYIKVETSRISVEQPAAQKTEVRSLDDAMKD